VGGGTGAGEAQIPAIPPDEKDFEGLTSLSLGSGARAFGMGGAFLARADDATAASWNPAGLSYLRRPEFTAVGARNRFHRGPDGQASTDRLRAYTPDFAAATVPFEWGSVAGAVQGSFQRVFSFKGERTIDRPDRIRFRTNTEGGFDVLALGVGLRFSRAWRLGGALNRWVGGPEQFRLRTTPAASRGTSEQDIRYSLRGWNLNLGGIWSPRDDLSFGVVAKTPFEGRLQLTRQRTDAFGLPDDPETTTGNAAGPLPVSLDFPAAFGLGVSWRPRNAWTVSADYTRTWWSDGRIRGFFLLPATPVGGPAPAPQVFAELPYPTLDDPDQTDTQQVRLGGEYVVVFSWFGKRVRMPVRLGAFTDRQYFRALEEDGVTRGPVPWFHGFTVGWGLGLGPVMLDGAYVHERGAFREADSAGRIFTRTERIFVSIIVRDDRGR
jgi:hypothetical protein